MPGKDGTGPMGTGPGIGGGRGHRRRYGRKGIGAGPGGSCICPNCGTTLPHQAGIPCSTAICPKCQIPMMRN